jgi:tetratricopeptide (TPR) repeat protein
VAEVTTKEKKIEQESAIPLESKPAAATGNSASDSPPMRTSTVEPVKSHTDDNANTPRGRRGKSEAEWLILLHSTFANRLVVASMVGLVLVAVGVIYMAATHHPAAHLDQNDVDALQLRAERSVKSNNLKGGIVQYAYARQLQEKLTGADSPKVATIALVLAQAYMQAKDSKNAEAQLTRAIAINAKNHESGPDAVQALSLRSDIYMFRGDKPKALADLQTAVAMESKTGSHGETATRKKLNALNVVPQHTAGSNKETKEPEEANDAKSAHKSGHHKAGGKAHRHAYSSYGY